MKEYGTLNPENGHVIPWKNEHDARRASAMIPGHTLMVRDFTEWEEVE